MLTKHLLFITSSNLINYKLISPMILLRLYSRFYTILSRISSWISSTDETDPWNPVSISRILDYYFNVNSKFQLKFPDWLLIQPNKKHAVFYSMYHTVLNFKSNFKTYLNLQFFWHEQKSCKLYLCCFICLHDQFLNRLLTSSSRMPLIA